MGAIIEFDARSGNPTGRIILNGRVWSSSPASLSSVGVLGRIVDVAGLASVGKAVQLYNLAGTLKLTGTSLADGFTIVAVSGKRSQISPPTMTARE